MPTGEADETVPLARSPQWARVSGILGALGAWVNALDTFKGLPPDLHFAGPVYGRRDVGTRENVMSFEDLCQELASSRLWHISPDFADPAGLALPPNMLEAALHSGCVLVQQDDQDLQADATVWIPSIDPAVHRPSILLTAVQPAVNPLTDSIALGPRSYLESSHSPLATTRALYRSVLLQTLSDIESLGVQFFDSSLAKRVRIPRLPKGVGADRIQEINGVLDTLAILDQVRRTGDSSSAGAARRSQLLNLATATSDLHRNARRYLDALWNTTFVDSKPGMHTDTHHFH